jgi:hypothetical protein
VVRAGRREAVPSAGERTGQRLVQERPRDANDPPSRRGSAAQRDRDPYLGCRQGRAGHGQVPGQVRRARCRGVPPEAGCRGGGSARLNGLASDDSSAGWPSRRLPNPSARPAPRQQELRD